MKSRAYRWLLLVGIAISLMPQVGHAQQVRHYSFVLRGVPLQDALRHLITTTHLDLSYDPSLVADKRTYCVADKQPAEAVLRCILRNTGLDFYRLSSGLYVLTETAEAPPRYGHLQGLVTDHETGEPLVNAHIALADGHTGTITNEAGRFTFPRLAPGPYQLVASYLGYLQRVDSVWVTADERVDAQLALRSEPILVAPVIVDGLQWRHASDSLGTVAHTQETLLQTASGSTADVLRGLSTLVGVQLNDAASSLHVQGGEEGEHQFRLDGAPVFIPVRTGGLIGPFSPFAIDRLTVHKAGFGPQTGSQISGVIDAHHVLGQRRGEALDVQLDPLSLNARLGLDVGPPEKPWGTLMVAGRYGLSSYYTPPTINTLLEDWNRTDPFMLTAFLPCANANCNPTQVFRQEFSSGEPRIGFYDVHAASRVRFGTLQSLFLSTYVGHRDLDSAHNPFVIPEGVENRSARARDLYAWTNSTHQARYEAVLSSRTLLRLRGRGSLYQQRHDIVVDDPANDDPSARRIEQRDSGNRIQEFALEAQVDYSAQDRWHLTAGVEPTYTFSRFLIQGTQRLPIIHRSSGWRVAGFVANRFMLTPRLTLEAGSRFTYLYADETAYAEPRLSVRYDHEHSPIGPWSVRLATGLYRQFVSQFDISSRSARGLSASTRTWLATDSTVSPPQATHLSAEFLVRPVNAWTIRLEGFYKKQPHLLAVDYSVNPPNRQHLVGESIDRLPSLPQQNFLSDGEGFVYGGTVLTELKADRARLEARYGYSRAERSFGAFYEGASIATPWNEPHRFDLTMAWTTGTNLTFLVRWRGVWGRTWGFRQSYYDFLGAYRTLSPIIPDGVEAAIVEHLKAYRLPLPEQHRLPPIYQLDFSLAHTLLVGDVKIQTRLDALNIFDRDNVADWRFGFDRAFYQQRGLLRPEARLLLPFTPSLALRLSR